MIKPLKEPLEIVEVDGDPTKAVWRYVEHQGHTSSFGFEWTHYSRIQTDSTLGTDLSRTRLELNMALPLEFLKGMNVLELGCGPGRFTEQLANYAKSVVAIDLSDAIYVNVALGRHNVLALQADLLDVPPLSEPIDMVFCRGVIQHTPNPRATLKKLFEYTHEGGFVIFDVYRKFSRDGREFKYFWRPFFKKYIRQESFETFLKKQGGLLYGIHHRWLAFIRIIPLLERILAKTPFYLSNDWNRQYPQLNLKKRIETFRADMHDGLYAEYDQPMYLDEVIETLAEIGQIPYSFDYERNHFRYKKRLPMTPIKVKRTKNGVFQVDSI